MLGLQDARTAADALSTCLPEARTGRGRQRRRAVRGQLAARGQLRWARTRRARPCCCHADGHHLPAQPACSFPAAAS